MSTTATTLPPRLILPLDSAATNNNTKYSDLRLAHYSPYRIYAGRCFSTSVTLKEENADDGIGDGGDSNNTPQSPLSSPLTNMSANDPTRKSRKKKFVPRKAAVELTERARTLFQKLLENHPTRDGILLNYNQSSTGEPRMVFSFSFVSKDELDEQDEGVSLEVDEDGNPKSPRDALDDGLPKLYVHHNAFLKVLGATVDVDTENITPKLYDKEGFELDANA